jgi:hypothetical protein
MATTKNLMIMKATKRLKKVTVFTRFKPLWTGRRRQLDE